MFANPRKSALLKERTDTMELMRTMLERIKFMPLGKARDDYMEAIKFLGKDSADLKALIEKEDREGVPEKWKKHYEIIGQFEKLCQK